MSEETWIITSKGWRGFSVEGPVTKRTPLRVTHPCSYRKVKDGFTNMSDVVCEGDEKTIRAAHERLISSHALMVEEQRKARERHSERVKKIVAKVKNDES